MGRIIFSRFNYRAGGKGRGREGEGVREGWKRRRRRRIFSRKV